MSTFYAYGTLPESIVNLEKDILEVGGGEVKVSLRKIQGLVTLTIHQLTAQSDTESDWDSQDTWKTGLLRFLQNRLNEAITPIDGASTWNEALRIEINMVSPKI